jgi:hypothetical protein
MSESLCACTSPFVIPADAQMEQEINSLKGSEPSLAKQFRGSSNDNDRNGLSYTYDQSNDVEPLSRSRWSVPSSDFLPPLYVTLTRCDSRAKGNPNWKPMASLDVPPLKINRSISVEKPERSSQTTM